jgi:acyl-CoA thioesterase-1
VHLIIPVIVIVSVISGLFIYYNGYSDIRKNPDIKENQIKVACVGDSITYGFGISNWPVNNYPKKLQRLLGDNYNVANFGVSGRCVGRKTFFPYLKTKNYLHSLEYNADILVFMLGSNDSKPFNWKGKEKFKEEYLSLLETYVKEGKTKVYLCTISKAYYPEGRNTKMTSYFIQPEKIEEIVDIIREMAIEKDYILIDIHKLTSENHNWFCSDNVHLNKEGAKAIAEKVYEYIKKVKVW